MRKIPQFVARAHGVSLLGVDGYTYADKHAPHRFSPYAGYGLGDPMPAYDLGVPGAVREVKQVLRALGQAESDPFQKAPSEVAIETRWKDLTDDDVWDAAAGEEMLLAISRYRGLGFEVPEPYVQMPDPGGSPQPAVNGLELLAGAARQRLGGAALLSKYEAWRKKGCTLQTACFDPPSAISRPASDTPVTKTQQTGLRIVAPADAPTSLLALATGADMVLQSAWLAASAAGDETARLNLLSAMQEARKARDAAHQAALDAAPGRTGTTITTNLDAELAQCKAAGGTWDAFGMKCVPKQPGTGMSGGALLACAGALAVGLWWVLRDDKKKRST